MSNITNLKELKEKRYITVNLPGWNIDDVFTCKLKRVSVMDLACKGKIPNPLIPSVIDLFKGDYKMQDSLKDIDGIKKVNDLINFFAEVTLVEPTFKEVEEAIGLTEEQKMLIYAFAIKGVRAIEPFLEKSGDN